MVSSEFSTFSDYDLEVDEDDDVDVDLNSDALQELNLNKFPYSEEPLADQEWVKDYNQKVKETEELKEQLVKRLDGTISTSEWYVKL